MSFNKGQCVICGVLCKGFLCPRHRRAFRFIKKYGFFVLKPRIKISKAQKALYLNIRSLVKKLTYQEVTFDFLHYSRYDIVCPDIRLIVEYDGQQHFKFVKMFHKDQKGFEEYKHKEKVKEDFAKVNDWSIIRFSYVEKVEDKEYVKKVLGLKCPIIKV